MNMKDVVQITRDLIIFGPFGKGEHGPEEWVSISSLEKEREILKKFVEKLI